MADTAGELNKHFAPHGTQLEPDVQSELQSILRLHSISPQELFYKWESYSIKMGGDPLRMELKTARDLKRDIQDALERETRGKVATRMDRRAVGVTPRAPKTAGGDVFGMMDGVVQSTPRQPMSGINGNSVKRRNDFDTPGSKTAKAHASSSPTQGKTPASTRSTGVSNIPFAERTNAGTIVESLNSQIEWPEAPSEPTLESRISLKSNTEISKFRYKNMAMKLSEASEILDDRIDEVLANVQLHHQLEDSAFGNPAIQSPSEIIAVGRIASDSGESRLTSGSIVLETSRRSGAGLRVPLKLDGLSHYELFSGKIVAIRGSNASGEAFTVSEILSLPQLPPAASTVAELDAVNARLQGGLPSSETDSPRPLNLITSAGPYTADSNLDFEPLQALCDRAIETRADALVMLGPFLDIEHPLVATGQFPPLPESLKVRADEATLNDVFRALISLPLQRLVQAQPGIAIVMVPSVRDAVSKHASWPQDRLPRNPLGLPKQCSMVPNPAMISLNEVVLGVSSQDALFELRPFECVAGAHNTDLLARLSGHLIEQRHFFPLYPPAARESLPKPTAVEGEEPKATGAMLDLGYLALGDWQKIKPDVLVTPSALSPFAKVVNSVLVVNPGQLSKKKAPGTFAQMCVREREVGDDERAQGETLAHRLFERTRVDVVRI